MLSVSHVDSNYYTNDSWSFRSKCTMISSVSSDNSYIADTDQSAAEDEYIKSVADPKL